MGTDDPTIEKIYDRQDKHRDDILGAISKVNETVQANAIQGAKTEATVDGLATRMTGMEDGVKGRLKSQDGRIATIESRLWKVAGAGGASGAVASILLKLVFG